MTLTNLSIYQTLSIKDGELIAYLQKYLNALFSVLIAIANFTGRGLVQPPGPPPKLWKTVVKSYKDIVFTY